MTKVKFVNGSPVVPAASDGPVPALMAGELTLARSGALDTDLLSQQPFYGTNFTKPLLFIEDGAYFVNKATALGLTGSQWGVMNETGSYPGQPWLWLYTLWYQVPGWTNSANIDMIAIYMTGLATILLLLVPFIPGLRDIPRLIPVHRLIWRALGQPGSGPGPPPGPDTGVGHRKRQSPRQDPHPFKVVIDPSAPGCRSLVRGRRDPPDSAGRGGAQGSFCSPAAVSRYPGAMVAGSARTRSTRADPAISGVSSSPICFRNASSVWPPRAAYARTPRLPTSPSGVILGITAVTVMPSPARRDSSWAYPAMNRWVALAPAYPPLAGDPLTAAPLLTTTTLAARRQRLQQCLAQPGERDLDVGMPVDGERLPRLVLKRAHHGVSARDQDENLRLVLVQQAPRRRRVGRIRDLGPDVRAGGGQLGQRRAGPGDGDHPSTSLGERACDPAPQAPAGADDDSGPARQVTHISFLFLCRGTTGDCISATVTAGAMTSDDGCL